MFNTKSEGGRDGWSVAVVFLLLLSGRPLLGDVVYWPLNGLEVATQRGSSIQCADRLRQIAQAGHVWANDNASQPPPSLQMLTNELGSPAALFCPADVVTPIPTNWAQVDWSQIDYQYVALSNWDTPADVICTCRIHSNSALVEGSVQVGDFRPGWPRVTAAPFAADATPGEDVRFQVGIATNAAQPLRYQWRRENLQYMTNRVWVPNPDDPKSGYWQTNVTPKFTPADLPGQTNPVFVLSVVRTNDLGFYSVAASNSVGTAVCHPVRVRVDSSFAGMDTNPIVSQATCGNNLTMFSILANTWEAQHVGQMPPSFGVMTNSDNSLLFGWPAALFCRADTNRVAPADWSGADLNNTSYELLAPDPQNPTAVLCRCKVHGYYVEVGGGVVVRPQFHGITSAPNNTVLLSFRVFADRTNSLEASDDLTHWTSRSTYGPTNGDLTFSETNALSRRFYRLRLP